MLGTWCFTNADSIYIIAAKSYIYTPIFGQRFARIGGIWFTILGQLICIKLNQYIYQPHHDPFHPTGLLGLPALAGVFAEGKDWVGSVVQVGHL